MPFYNRIILFVLFLISWNQGISQSINLKINGENASSTKIIDSIGYPNTYDDYKSLQTEINTLKEKLTKHGYIDTTIENIIQQNDTLFKADFILGKRINRIRIIMNLILMLNFSIQFIDLKRIIHLNLR